MSDWFEIYGFDEVLDDLLIGAYPLDEGDVAALSEAGIGRILNLVEDREYRPGEHEMVARALAAAGIEERRLALVDYGGLAPESLERAVDVVNEWLDEGTRCYVHCRAGWQRSAAVAAGVVAVRMGVDVESALDFVQQRKATADPLPHQRDDLRGWFETRGQRPRQR